MGASLPIRQLWERPPDGKRVRLGTLNMGLVPIRVSALERWVERERIDVICFQEGGRDDPEFRKFLDTIHARVPATLEVHLILDNSSTHKTPAIHRWLTRHPRFHRHFTPTSSSWINLVERWFAALTEKQLRRGVHRSTRELEAAIRRYIEITNGHPKPFVWTKTADEILESVARFCHRISNSGH